MTICFGAQWVSFALFFSFYVWLFYSPEHIHPGKQTQFPVHVRGRRAHCELKNRMTECQHETGVVNGLLVAGASWLRLNRSILERKAEQRKGHGETKRHRQTDRERRVFDRKLNKG